MELRRSQKQRIAEKWKEDNDTAKALIGLNVEDSQLCHIRSKETAKEMWNNLKEIHQKNTIVNKVTIMRQICSTKLEENGNVENHINTMATLFGKLHDLNEAMTEKWMVALLLSSLPKSFDTKRR